MTVSAGSRLPRYWQTPESLLLGCLLDGGAYDTAAGLGYRRCIWRSDRNLSRALARRRPLRALISATVGRQRRAHVEGVVVGEQGD